MSSAAAVIDTFRVKIQGPVVQNLMKLLANMMLTFLSWYMANSLIFFAEKIRVATHIFAAKLSMYLKIP